MKKTHWHGLDLIRLIALFAIIHLHVYEMIFYQDDLPKNAGLMSVLVRSLSFSVFTIITLISFLYGLKRSSKRRWKKLSVLLPLGVIVMLFTQGDTVFTDLYFKWDIFGFLSVSAFSLYLLEKYPKSLKYFAFLGAVLLCLPLWEWFSLSNSFLADALIGSCIKGQAGNAFPVFPWIGLIWLCFGLGRWTRENGKDYLFVNLRYKEAFFWLIILALSAPQWGAYYLTPGGPSFFCFMLRQSPLIFLSHFSFILFSIRLSLLFSINQFLSKKTFFCWLSRLFWMRFFGASYLTHFIFIALFSLLLPLDYTDWYISLGSAFAFISTELFLRILMYGFNKFQFKHKISKPS